MALFKKKGQADAVPIGAGLEPRLVKSDFRVSSNGSVIEPFVVRADNKTSRSTGSLTPSALKMVTIIETFRRDMQATETLRLSESKMATTEANTTIERARAFVVSTGVASALIYVLDKTKPYPVWAKRDDWEKWNALQVTTVDGIRSVDDKSRPLNDVSFTRDGQRYRFTELKHNSGFDGSVFGSLILAVNDEPVLDIKVVMQRGDSFAALSEWIFVDVFVLTVGPWVSALMEMEALIRVFWTEWSEQTRIDSAREQASRLQL